MKQVAGREKTEEIYQDWVKGTPITKLQNKYKISRQRIYQLLNDYKQISDKDKMLRAVNKFSR